MTQVNPREREGLLAKIPGALDVLRGTRKKAETTERILEAAGVKHKAVTVTEETVKAALDDWKVRLGEVIGEMFDIDEAALGEIAGAILLRAAEGTPDPVVEEVPVEEMEVNDPDAPTEPVDDDEDDPALKVKALQTIITKQARLTDRLITSQDGIETSMATIAKSVESLDAKADAAIRAETAVKALMERVGKVEAALSLRPRASNSAETNLETMGLSSDVLKALNDAAKDVVTDPVWGAVNRK